MPGLDARRRRRGGRGSTWRRTTSTSCEPRTSTTTTGCSSRAAARLGYRVEQFPLNLDGCQGSGLCNLGCPNAAKHGHAPRPAARRGAAGRRGRHQLPRCERIEERAVVATRARARRSASRPRGRRATTGSAPRRSSSPAARSARRRCCCARGSRRRLPALGPLLHVPPGAHPRRRARRGRSRTTSATRRAIYCDHFAESDGFLLETCMYFPFTTAKNLTGFGAEHSADDVGDGPAADDPGARLRPAGAGQPRHGGRGGPSRWCATASREGVRRSLVRATRASARIFFAAGAARVHAPAARPLLHRGGGRGPRSTSSSRERHFKLGQGLDLERAPDGRLPHGRGRRATR